MRERCVELPMAQDGRCVGCRNSATGNCARVVRVTSGNSNHYNTAELVDKRARRSHRRSTCRLSASTLVRLSLLEC